MLVTPGDISYTIATFSVLSAFSSSASVEMSTLTSARRRDEGVNLFKKKGIRPVHI